MKNQDWYLLKWPKNFIIKAIDQQAACMKKPAIVLITGCSSGIGLASALFLKNKGLEVVPTARKPQDLEKLSQLGFDPINCDVADSEQVEHAAKLFLQRAGQKTIGLINNAGYVEPGELRYLDRTTLERQFASNVFGLHQLTQLLLPHCFAQKAGRIIHVSSVLGFVPKVLIGAYNASKYAVEGLGDTLRLELNHHPHIHVSIVEPGPIQSNIFDNAVKTLGQRDQGENNQGLLKAMQHDSAKTLMKLPPEAVAKAFYHALTAHKPKAHYRITLPCQSAAVLKRILPTTILDKLLLATDPDTSQLSS